MNLLPGDWYCPQCNHHNFAARTICQNCQTPNNNQNRGGGGMSRPSMLPGDWHCPLCSHHNFASRSHCQSCLTPKTSMTYTQHYQPYGQYPKQYQPYNRQHKTIHPGKHPGDWICSLCNYHNFASRSQCQKCTNPKPNLQETNLTQTQTQTQNQTSGSNYNQQRRKSFNTQ